MFAARDPGGARVLASLDVPCRYVEPGISLRAERPVLRCDQAGRLVQLSFNAYDREPFLLADPEEWDRFADAYDGLGAILADESRWLRLEWQPGRLLMFDNWRVLHGRGSFTGSRRFLGCYLNHEDLESAWRVHGI
jgi:alpha-ketoglutarate-dependent taurine dioxygenase